MDPVSLIVTALAAGAAAGLKPTAEKIIKDAYEGIKTLIKRKYDQVDLASLEKKPQSQAKRDSVAEDLSDAGAAEVHVLVSCPPHVYPCFYGIDFPDRSKLMAYNHTTEEIREYLNADSLGYLSVEGMVRATGKDGADFCMACYDGDYPVPYDPTVDKHIMEQRRHRGQGIGEGLDKDAVQTQLL